MLSGGRVELGLGAGWMTTDYEQSGIPYDRPGVRVDRMVEGLAVIKGLFADGAVRLRGRALHDHRARRPAQAADHARTRRSSSAAAASACCRSPRARPTSSASTPTCSAGAVGRRRPPPTPSPARRPEDRTGSRRRPATASTTSSSTASPSLTIVTDDRDGTGREAGRRCSASTPTRCSRSPTRSSARSTRSATTSSAGATGGASRTSSCRRDGIDALAPVVARLTGTLSPVAFAVDPAA